MSLEVLTSFATAAIFMKDISFDLDSQFPKPHNKLINTPQ